ncbi:MAG: leucine-rich repeat domain-containing protein [Clostridia bacterium]|nr:leucine-rich repeat domain-containing protein [Clostridia bacterium]
MKTWKLAPVGYHRVGRWEYTLRFDGSICLHACHGNRAELHIPDTLLGRPVTALGHGFIGPNNACTIIIPDSVRTIGKYAFSNDKRLSDIWVPDTVTEIHEDAFSNSHSLCIHTPLGSCAQAFAIDHDISYRTDVMPDPVDEQLLGKESGDWHYSITPNKKVLLLEYNGNAENLTVPAEFEGYPVREVMGSCFYGNDYLREVTLPEGLNCVGHFAFAECPSLRSVRVAQSVTFLGGGVFAGCSDLEEVNLPPALNMLHMSTFSSCTSLRRIALPDQLRIICPMAFGSCTALEEIQLNDKLQTVPMSAFWKCPNLRRPDKLPDSLDEEARATFNALQD